MTQNVAKRHLLPVYEILSNTQNTFLKFFKAQEQTKHYYYYTRDQGFTDGTINLLKQIIKQKIVDC